MSTWPRADPDWVRREPEAPPHAPTCGGNIGGSRGALEPPESSCSCFAASGRGAGLQRGGQPLGWRRLPQACPSQFLGTCRLEQTRAAVFGGRRPLSFWVGPRGPARRRPDHPSSRHRRPFSASEPRGWPERPRSFVLEFHTGGSRRRRAPEQESKPQDAGPASQCAQRRKSTIAPPDPSRLDTPTAGV